MIAHNLFRNWFINWLRDLFA